MLLRGNLQRAGLTWSGRRYEGHYALAWRGDEVVGTAAHGWNDMLLVQADEAIGELAAAAIASSGRTVAGLAGPPDQISAAREAIGLGTMSAIHARAEVLMSLSLDALLVPPALAEGRGRARRATSSERDQLVAWRAAYMMELVGKAPSPDLDAQAADDIDAGLHDRRVWIIEAEGAVVSMTMFNAELPDCVQVGGVYTPPSLRGRGHARAVVAASLLDARARGVRRAVLFTPRPDAEAAYRAIGFATIGQFGLVVLR
jgi:GNAT superfamily N-acetyltransferase